MAPRWSLVALAAAFLVLAVALAIDPPGGRGNWLMGNVPTLVAVVAVTAAFVRYPPSATSATLVALFLALHEVGVHYGYRVPLAAVELGRNEYDRVVHVAFGLLLTSPLRELLVRSGKAAGAWADLLSVALLLSLAALYEVTEWVGAELFWPGPAEDFLGFQGDPLDATKDMALALAGSLVAWLAMATARRVRARRTEALADGVADA